MRRALEHAGLVAQHHLPFLEGADAEDLRQLGLLEHVLVDAPRQVPHVERPLAGDDHLHLGLGPELDDGVGRLELVPEGVHVHAGVHERDDGVGVGEALGDVGRDGLALQRRLDGVGVGVDLDPLHAGAGGVPDRLERVGEGDHDVGVVVVLAGLLEQLDVILPVAAVELLEGPPLHGLLEEPGRAHLVNVDREAAVAVLV
jgi:hypothetical protein